MYDTCFKPGDFVAIIADNSDFITHGVVIKSSEGFNQYYDVLTDDGIAPHHIDCLERIDSV